MRSRQTLHSTRRKVTALRLLLQHKQMHRMTVLLHLWWLKLYSNSPKAVHKLLKRGQEPAIVRRTEDGASRGARIGTGVRSSLQAAGLPVS